MRVAAKVAAFQLVDVIRSRWLIGYTAFFLLATELLLRFGGDATRALVSLTSVVLFIVPLAAIVFATVYVHSAREFIELVLAQPVGRGSLFAGTYAAMVISVSAGVVVGIGLPFALRGGAGVAGPAAVLIATGVALTLVFAGAGVAIALRTEDRVRAFGIALGTWACAALLYDAALLVLATAMANYPLERPLLLATIANPIDLARVTMLAHLDTSALMGYTGSAFTRLFGAAAGAALAAAALAAWAAMPAVLGARAFRRKDF